MVTVLLPSQGMGGVPQVGADTVAVVIYIEVGYTMMIVGYGFPGELALLPNEETIDVGGDVDARNANALGKRVVDIR